MRYPRSQKRDLGHPGFVLGGERPNAGGPFTNQYFSVMESPPPPPGPPPCPPLELKRRTPSNSQLKPPPEDLPETLAAILRATSGAIFSEKIPQIAPISFPVSTWYSDGTLPLTMKLRISARRSDSWKALGGASGVAFLGMSGKPMRSPKLRVPALNSERREGAEGPGVACAPEGWPGVGWV